MFGYVLIVGRPNVGKSSLFNALTGHKIAIVSDVENTTRDTLEYEVRDEETGAVYTLADSGGLNFGTDDEILEDVRERVFRAMDRADLVLFAVDSHGLSAADQRIADLLRAAKKPVFVVANKADNDQMEMEAYAAARLGFDAFFPISVSHRRGLTDLRLNVAKTLKKMGFSISAPEVPQGIKVAIIGRPNVGKSSLLNAILGEDRAIVKDMPGTTRDTTDVGFEYQGKPVVLIDTAGIRKSGRIDPGIEAWSVERTDRAIARCDVAACVIDGAAGITAQDQHVIQRALESQKGVVIVVNKWDLVLAKKKTATGVETAENDYRYDLQRRFPFLSWATAIFTTATEGNRVTGLLDAVLGVQAERERRIPTGLFNKFLEQVAYQHAPSGNRKSHKPKIFYGTQADVNPPRFVLSVNDPGHFHFSYRRYMENKLREHFGFQGTPVVMEYRGRDRQDYSEREKARMEKKADANIAKSPRAPRPSVSVASGIRHKIAEVKKRKKPARKEGFKNVGTREKSDPRKAKKR